MNEKIKEIRIRIDKDGNLMFKSIDCKGPNKPGFTVAQRLDLVMAIVEAIYSKYPADD